MYELFLIIILIVIGFVCYWLGAYVGYRKLNKTTAKCIVKHGGFTCGYEVVREDGMYCLANKQTIKELGCNRDGFR